ncbi:hypothetical protein ACFL59_11770 [Planctomycetota bacterium]
MGTGSPLRTAFYRFTIGGRRHHLGESLAQQLASLLVQRGSDRVEIYSRRKLGRVLEEQGFQATGLVDEATLVSAGRLSGVDTILTGRVVHRPGREIVLNCQILAIETGEVLGGGHARIPLSPVAMGRPVHAESAAARFAAGELLRPLPAERSWLIAVYDINRSREPFAAGTEFAKAVETELSQIRRPNLRTLTRAELGQIAQEQEFQGSGLVDENTRARVAAVLGGNAVLTGYGETFDDVHMMNVQLIEVESARIRSSAIVLVAR